MSDKRALKLLEAFSGVDEDLLERCESAVESEKVISLADRLKDNLKRNSRKYASAAAAVFCLIIVGALSLNGLRMTSNDSAAFEAVMDEMSGGAEAPGNGLQATASDSATDYVVAESDRENGFIGQADGSSNIGLYSDSAGMNGSTNGTASGSTGGEETQKVQQENSANVAENTVGNAEEKSASTERIDDLTTPEQESLKTDKDAAEGCKTFEYVAVSEKDAGAHEIFGVYVLTKLPEGYCFEGAYVSGEEEASALMVSWTRGLDSIMVNITLPEKAPITVDVTRTEMYDEYLYEIPHAETVPEAYWEVFNNPVCAWEDFSLEFVQKRMIARDDAGDTDTPRGNFSVLYPDGVLVYFNGRGTAEEIWNLFDSMEASKQ